MFVPVGIPIVYEGDGHGSMFHHHGHSFSDGDFLYLQVSAQLQGLHLSENHDSSGVSSEAPPSAPYEARASMLQRWPEFAGAFLLYFVCIPAVPEVRPSQR